MLSVHNIPQRFLKVSSNSHLYYTLFYEMLEKHHLKGSRVFKYPD